MSATRPRVVVLDYGSGNLRSAQRALDRAGAQVDVTGDFAAALDCDGLVVPGVGAFAACMAGLRAVRGDMIIDRRLAGGRPVLGICVGMQVLFETGDEHGVRIPGLRRVAGHGRPGWPRRCCRTWAGTRCARRRARCCSRAWTRPPVLLRALLRGHLVPLEGQRQAGRARG